MDELFIISESLDSKLLNSKLISLIIFSIWFWFLIISLRINELFKLLTNYLDLSFYFVNLLVFVNFVLIIKSFTFYLFNG
jgi:hypothetical protein